MFDVFSGGESLRMASLIGQMLDQYRLVEQVGRGGMATVYRAVDTRTKREVAIKVLSPSIGTDKRFVRRFRREATLVSRLKHPNIVPVVGYGECRGYVYLAMPFVEGETLQERMNRGPLTEPEATRWVGQLASALEFAHRRGVIHRDVKPSNVMIDKGGNALLMDFGLARMVESSNTLTGSMLVGTPAYVSPEQGQGRPVDARSDEYSLGIILFQIATGHLPYEGETPMTTVLMHIQEPIPRPSRLNPGVPPALDAVIMKSLAKEPRGRFPSAAALGKAYLAALEGKPVAGVAMPSALPPSAVSRAGLRGPSAATPEPSPRRRSSLGWPLTVASILMLVLIGFVAYPWVSSLLGATRATATLSVLASPPPVQTDAPPIILGPVTATAPQSTPLPTDVASPGCPDLRLIGFGREGASVYWTVDNGGTADLRLQDLFVEGPQTPSVVMFGSAEYWRLPPGATPDPGASLQVPRDETSLLAAGTAKRLELQFPEQDTAPLYNVTLTFEGGCTLHTVW
jgi:serine/threonine-protein kinase